MLIHVINRSCRMDRKRKILFAAILTVFIVCALGIVFQFDLVSKRVESRESLSSKITSRLGFANSDEGQTCYKQVQVWHNEIRPFHDIACPGLRCGIRYGWDHNIQTLRESDAVFLMHTAHWDWYELHRNRPPNQKWIFYSQESPLNTRDGVIPPPQYYNSSYDYIMSYRFREAQFYGGYGRYITYNSTKSAIDVNKNWAQGKTRLAAWVSSNCDTDWLHWNRKQFVQALSRLVQVDMYGTCGNLPDCPRGQRVEACKEILRQHKFYLSLENCKCRDYITEKFWVNAYHMDMVPIVFGPPRSDYEAVAPPNSFIHIEDFPSIQALAEYLKLLDKNDHLYNRYFEWRKHGYVESTREDWIIEPLNMCRIVKRMLDEEDAKRNGTYKRTALPDWDSWWFGSCKPINKFPIEVNI